MQRKKIIIIIVSAVIVLFLAGYWYWQSKGFSTESLNIRIAGPEKAQVGDEIIYTVKYKNTSGFILKNPKLSFEYPQYSVSDSGKVLEIKDLKDINPGAEETMQYKARLFGAENDIKIAKVSISYTPQNLSAEYESGASLATAIMPVPLNLSFDLPSKVETGKDIQFSLNYFSNIDYPLSDVRITISAPNGFVFSDSDPKSLDNVEWDIDSLKKTEGGRINISGRVDSNAGDNLNFGAKIGIWKNGDFVLLKEAGSQVQAIGSQISITQKVNGTQDYVASPGEALHYEVYVKNTSTSPFKNLYVTDKLNSPGFDLSSLSVKSGSASDNSAAWDWSSNKSLGVLNPGQEIKLEFSIKLKDSWPATQTRPNDTNLDSKVTVGDASRDFSTKINSKLTVSQVGAYQDDGIFGNSGPQPPAVGQDTTYTINWRAQNFYNDVKNVKVKAVLAPGVTLTGKILPSTQVSNFSLDSASREIVWSVADYLPAGAGAVSSAPEINFQISFTPSQSQANPMPLISKLEITGEDQYTGKTIDWAGSQLDTNLSNDSNLGNDLNY
jgi:fimbrial isopeptide formation D2 family protein